MRAVLTFLAASLIATVVSLIPAPPAWAAGFDVGHPFSISTAGFGTRLSGLPPTAAAMQQEDPPPDPDEGEAINDAVEKLQEDLEAPGWQIWPSHEHNQIVNLDTWLHVAAGWENKTADGSADDHDAEVIAKPTKAIWSFTESTTGRTSTVTCEGPGKPWSDDLPDTEVPECAKSWEHSTDVTGLVEISVAIVYEVSGGALPEDSDEDLGNVARPITEIRSPESEARPLTVAEVQTWSVDDLPEVPDAIEPAGAVGVPKDCSGFFSFCWISEGIKALAKGIVGLVDLVVDGVVWVAKKVGEAIIAAIPGAKAILDFIAGCAEFAIEALKNIGELIKTIVRAVTDFKKFVEESWALIKGVGEAFLKDPVEFAKEFLAGVVDLELLKENPAKWAGKMSCEVLATVLTGGTATGLSKALKKITPSSLKKFLDKLDGKKNGKDSDGGDSNEGADRNDAGNGDSDGGDRDDARDKDDATDDDGESCRISSFPTGTQVLMADGTQTSIELIRPGDYVISYNVDTGVWEPKLVLDQWSHRDRGPPATATLDDGSTITATDDHQFWVMTDGASDWRELQHLNEGDQLLSPERAVTVENITVGPRHPWTVWELTVADNHNFTVSTGTDRVLVHNGCSETKYDGDFSEFDDKFKPKNKETPTFDANNTTQIKPGTKGGWRYAPRIRAKRDRDGNDIPPSFEGSQTSDGGMVFKRKSDGALVKYDKNGYPDFGPHAKLEVELTGFAKGDRPADFEAANKLIGKGDDWGNGAPDGYVWHHHKEGDKYIMQLLPEAIHSTKVGGFPHAGGVSQG